MTTTEPGFTMPLIAAPGAGKGMPLIQSDGGGDRMPQIGPTIADRLTPEQAALLKTWLDQGQE